MIEKFIDPKEQTSRLGSNVWSVSRLFELSRDFPVMEIPLAHLNVYYLYNGLTLRDMVMHMVAVNNADLSYPIILDEDGELMDGRHRIMKALLNGMETIKAVRFKKNPRACRVEND